MTEQNNQEYLIQLSVLQQQAEQIQQQITAIDRQISEMRVFETELNELKSGRGKEILAQVAKGIFIKSEIKEDNLFVNVGEKNFVKKNIEDTKKLIFQQSQRLNEVKKSLLEDLDKINKDLEKILGTIQSQQQS